MDRRLTPATERVAHVSLRGQVERPRWTEGDLAQVRSSLAELSASPAGGRERQLLFGARVLVVDRDGAQAFVQAVRDGYCGWVPATALGAPSLPTHWVCTPGTHLYSAPNVQATEVLALPYLAMLTVTAIAGAWAETPLGHVPLGHLRPVGDWAEDPVKAAEALSGSPYLWGGNSRAGLDCSGLVQLAHWACGLACPGDSDLQRAMGPQLAADAPAKRGDLIFWKGHVALMQDGAHILHANAHHMAVASEPLEQARARISANGGGDVLLRIRPAKTPLSID